MTWRNWLNISVAILVGLLTGVAAVDAQRGDIWSTRALEALEQILDSSGLVRFPDGLTTSGAVTLGSNDADDVTINGVPTFKVLREDFGSPSVGLSWLGAQVNLSGTALVTDNAENVMLMPGSPLGMIAYRFEGALAGSGFNWVDGGYLNLDIDDADNDGLELGFGYRRTSTVAVSGNAPWDEDLNQTWYCEVGLKIADISETDSLYFGWLSGGEATLDLGNWAGYNTSAFFVLSDALGDLDIVTELNAGGSLNDDTGVTWADGNEKVLRVTVAADSVSFTLDGTLVTQTNAVLNFDNGDRAGCVMGFLNATGDLTPEPGIALNYVEIGVSQP